MESGDTKTQEKPRHGKLVRIMLWSVAAAGVSGILFELASILSFLWTLKQVEGLIGQ